MARRTKLTPEVQAKIVEYISRGAFDYIAAQAAGIDPATFRRWVAAGRRGSPLYAEFCAEVSRARAVARAAAEAAVYQQNPFAWLRFGPGRDRPGEPGWTSETRLDVTSGGERVEVHLTLGADAPDDGDDEG